MASLDFHNARMTENFFGNVSTTLEQRNAARRYLSRTDDPVFLIRILGLEEEEEEQ